MEVTKDLTPALVKAEAKDQFYQVDITIKRLLAPQHYQRPFTYKKKGWGEVERVETTQDGTPTDLRSPQKKRRTRKGESEIKTGDCWTFKEEKEHILLPWGTHFGILKQCLRRSLEAQRKLRYESAPLALIKVYPTWLDVGKGPCESMKNENIPEVILETRHTSRGDVMVEVFFDYIEDRKATFFLEVDSENPINEEKLVGMLKSLNTLDNIGPSKRGSLQIDKMAQVSLPKEEMEKLQKGEAVKPVVY